MKSKISLLFLLPFLLIVFNFSFSIETLATIRYVSKTGSSIPPYTSWATAADSIQKCINICEDGDTIYIANGIYYESITINVLLTIIGSSMDSTIIDGRYSADQWVIRTNKHFNIRNVFIRNDYDLQYKIGIALEDNTGAVEYCRFEGIRDLGAVRLYTSSVNISNCFFRNIDLAIRLLCFEDTCNGTYSNNLMYLNQNVNAVNLTFGNSVNLINNIVIAENENYDGVYAYIKNITAIGNLIANFRSRAFYARTTTAGMGNIYLLNNLTNNIYLGAAFNVHGTPNTILKNNIATRSNIGFSMVYSPNVIIDYNLLWNVNQPSNGVIPLGDSNLINIDPMFVKDTIAVFGGNWDYHLQANSPAIDKGDPTILDPDGSRSDIGLYGGPFGEIYTYQDLAPRRPRNLSAVVDSGFIRLSWNRNTEADTSYYNVYRSTTASFNIDSTTLIASTKDTSFINIYFPIYERLYYKITCVDKQGNQSQPSEEIVINLTSISQYPTVVNDYYLYQNYPNPFNPKTKIAYKLKDRGYVKLMVYNIKGEIISVLVNQQQEAGYYEVEFNAANRGLSTAEKDIASGIYIYRIEVIGEGQIPVYTEMRKMLLLK